ncbi:MAG: carbon starvation protein A [Planctomycetota bacterium]
MDALWIALLSAAALFLGYRFYGRLIAHKVYDAGGFPDERLPSRTREDGIDFVPTKKSVLMGHHYVTIAGAGPIVGPAVAVTWGWLPALLWVVLGSIFIGAVHDFGSLVASVRNEGRTIGDLAADIMTPRVRTLFLAFIALALWVVLAVFAFVIAGLFVRYPESVPAVWIEVPLAMLVGTMVYRRKGSMLLWSLVALVLMYVAIGIGTLEPVKQLFSGGTLVFWLWVLFAYSYVASVLPVTRLLQPRDYINSHQLFLALAVLLGGLVVSGLGGSGAAELVAPAINDSVPHDLGAPMLYPFLFITIACGAISGFHCMVASGTTSRQLSTEKDARAIGYGSMILEGGLAVIVILCCCSAAGFADVAAWNAKYSLAWVGEGSLIAKLEGFIQGGAGFMHAALPFVGVQLLKVVVTVVIISFAATTMDSATRIQRYVLTELGDATGVAALRNKHVATTLAVGSAAGLAIFAGTGGSGGLVLWPVFGVMNQLLACLTFLILNTWLAKRGKPVIYTTLPMLFLLVTVSWAGVSQVGRFAADLGNNWHLVTVLCIGLFLEGWMIWEGISVFRLSLRVRAKLRNNEISVGEAQAALSGPTKSVIGADGIIRRGDEVATFPP